MFHPAPSYLTLRRLRGISLATRKPQKPFRPSIGGGRVVNVKAVQEEMARRSIQTWAAAHHS
jgi:hypothetical protein